MENQMIKYVSEKALREMLAGISAASVYRWVKSGILPQPRLLGQGRKAWLLSELQPVLEAFPVAAIEAPAQGCKRGRLTNAERTARAAGGTP